MGIGSLPPPSGSQGLNSDCQAWQPVPACMEPSCWSITDFSCLVVWGRKVNLVVLSCPQVEASRPFFFFKTEENTNSPNIRILFRASVVRG